MSSGLELYQIKLAARAEIPTDLLRVQNKFQEKIKQAMNNNWRNTIGHIKELSWKQIGFLPDIDIQLTLAVWVEEGENNILVMTHTLQTFLDACDETIDSHVLRESLNFADLYDGERKEHFLKYKDGIFSGLLERIEHVTTTH